MNLIKLALCGTLIFCIQSGVLAEQNADRTPFPSYDEKNQPGLAVTESIEATTLTNISDPSISQIPTNLNILRETHKQQYVALENRINSTISYDEQKLLEREMEELKKQNNLEELQLLLDNAEADGNNSYAANLREAIASETAPRIESNTKKSNPLFDPDAMPANNSDVHGGVK
jgi:hypothetical protein